MTARYLSALLGLLAACAPESTPASDAVQAEVGPSETRSDVAADTETSDSSSIPPPQAFESGQPDDTQANGAHARGADRLLRAGAGLLQ